MLTAWNVILLLKIAVTAVTGLLLVSLAALARGNYRLHGRINIVFFILTLSALLGLEGVARLAEPEMFQRYFKETNAENALSIHLAFSIPAAALLPFMLYTGLTHRRAVHLVLAVLFVILWTGTFVTGLFFLPHSPIYP
ncbi:MAG TPA: DUF420 domain-containing protein [Gemmataceae bacterium]|nr:DUF420 domain-containing protein [Gemmataceae bacterium]